ncbi:endonuclease-reverse transcriptase [Elysia marginata]|uniref:Endonuclease-reverse transcriptase n=1 Tax=Elysia marginata TaxID=1093978 RepID=A0AAV4JAT3_9GAST|nr:endonuclease-reverse transcriptase [Elysia marginata]
MHGDRKLILLPSDSPDDPTDRGTGEFLLQEILAEKRGISLNGENITKVRYADDTVIMVETPDSLQQMLDSIAESCKTYDKEMNVKKKKNYAYREREIESIDIDGIPQEQVTKYHYLGHMLT